MENNNDPVNSPSHYNKGKIQIIEFIEDQKFDYHIGNAIKYLCRHEHKDNPIQDLEKAIWYIKREILLLIKRNTPFIIPSETNFPMNSKPGKIVVLTEPPLIEETDINQIEKSMIETVKQLKKDEPLQVKFPNDFENHVIETCRWGGCFKCDPKGHKI